MGCYYAPPACGKPFVRRLKGARMRAARWLFASLCQAILEQGSPAWVSPAFRSQSPHCCSLEKETRGHSPPPKGRLCFWVACCQGCPSRGSPGEGGLGSPLQLFFAHRGSTPIQIRQTTPCPLHRHPGQPNLLNRDPQTFPASSNMSPQRRPLKRSRLHFTRASSCGIPSCPSSSERGPS